MQAGFMSQQEKIDHMANELRVVENDVDMMSKTISNSTELLNKVKSEIIDLKIDLAKCNSITKEQIVPGARFSGIIGNARWSGDIGNFVIVKLSENCRSGREYMLGGCYGNEFILWSDDPRTAEEMAKHLNALSAIKMSQ